MLPYGAGEGGAAPISIDCPLWPARMDLKAAFVKVVAEVTQQYSLSTRSTGAPRARGVSARFGGSAYQVTVLDGTVAAGMTAEGISIDLLVLLSDGLTEERLASLLRRWSKKARTPVDSSSMDALTLESNS